MESAGKDIQTTHATAKAFCLTSAFWMMVATFYGLLGATELVAPDLTENLGGIVFGRVRPTHVNLVLFGFVSPGLLGAAFYFIPHLLRTKLYSEKLGLTAAIAWNMALVAAVVSVSIDNIPDVWQRTAALQTLKRDADFEPLAAAFKRVVNILRKTDGTVAADPQKSLLQEPSETALYAAYQGVKSQVGLKMAQGDLEGALRVIATLRAPVDKFFDDVMVMTDDEALRDNRLALLKAIAGLFDRMADFSKIAT